MEINKDYKNGAFNYWTCGSSEDNPFSDKVQWSSWDNGWHDARAIDNGDIMEENHPADLENVK